ncbi:uncharacterized protein METZ01_LOCUS455816, partial [marine metagenome]
MVYDAKNDSSALTAYVQRKDYRDYAWKGPRTWPEPIDFWYDKLFYGRLDKHGNAIFVNDKFLTKANSKPDTTTFLLDFVAEAFKDLKEYYAVAANTGQIVTKNTNIVYLEAQHGWLSTNKEHVKYMKYLFKEFTYVFMGEKSKDEQVISFETYLPIFKEFLKNSLPGLPFTKTGYISSEFCGPATSGLVIDIANGQPGNDNEKFTKFLRDPNFVFYAIAAKKFGFKIDKNIPWRLVADV